MNNHPSPPPRHHHPQYGYFDSSNINSEETIRLSGFGPPPLDASAVDNDDEGEDEPRTGGFLQSISDKISASNPHTYHPSSSSMNHHHNNNSNYRYVVEEDDDDEDGGYEFVTPSSSSGVSFVGDGYDTRTVQPASPCPSPSVSSNPSSSPCSISTKGDDGDDDAYEFKNVFESVHSEASSIPSFPTTMLSRQYFDNGDDDDDDDDAKGLLPFKKKKTKNNYDDDKEMPSSSSSAAAATSFSSSSSPAIKAFDGRMRRHSSSKQLRFSGKTMMSSGTSGKSAGGGASSSMSHADNSTYSNSNQYTSFASYAPSSNFSPEAEEPPRAQYPGAESVAGGSCSQYSSFVKSVVGPGGGGESSRGDILDDVPEDEEEVGEHGRNYHDRHHRHNVHGHHPISAQREPERLDDHYVQSETSNSSSSTSHGGSKKSKNKIMCMMNIFLIFFLLLILFITTYFVLEQVGIDMGFDLKSLFRGKRKNRNSGNGSGPIPSPTMSPMPTIAPTAFFEACTPFSGWNNNNVRIQYANTTLVKEAYEDIKFNLLSIGTDDQSMPCDALDLAARWMAYDSALAAAAATTTTRNINLSQRLSLVVLYMSMNGKAWTYPEIGHEDDGVGGGPDTYLQPILDFPTRGRRNNRRRRAETTKSSSKRTVWLDHDTSECQWFGVNCLDGEIVSLDIYGMNISGTIPSHVGDLTALRRLDLSYNEEIFGTLPSEIGQLTSMEILLLDKLPKLQGDLPFESFGSMTNLRTLSLYRNNIGGEFRLPFDKLGSLEYLSTMSARTRLNWHAPSEIGLLTNLVVFEASFNTLTGIPSEALAKLSRLEVLHLIDNDIGTIPTEIGLLSALRYLDLGYNSKLGGTIPSEIGNLQNLEQFVAPRTSLTGPIPSELGNCTSLVNLVIPNLKGFGSEGLSGELASELGLLTNLKWLDLEGNSISGEVPNEILSLGKLEVLNLKNNEFSGTLPNITSLPDALECFDVAKNRLSPGVVPDGYCPEDGRQVVQVDASSSSCFCCRFFMGDNYEGDMGGMCGFNVTVNSHYVSTVQKNGTLSNELYERFFLL